MLSGLGRISHVRSGRGVRERWKQAEEERAVERGGREKREGEDKRGRTREKAIYTVFLWEGRSSTRVRFPTNLSFQS